MDIQNIKDLRDRLYGNISNIIVGKGKTIELIIVALLSKGHVLIEDRPGTGKTMLAKAVALSMSGEFKRIQFTPDLMPSDVTGINIYNQKEAEFKLMRGPVFTNILLADEPVASLDPANAVCAGAYEKPAKGKKYNSHYEQP